jgi:signal transduction histidine kinase
MKRLSVRLYFAFGLILVMTAAFTSGALLLVLRASPIDPDSTYLDLASTAVQINLQDLSGLRQEILTAQQDSPGLSLREIFLELVVARLDEQATEYNVRIILLEAGETIIFDTDGVYPRPLGDDFSREPFLANARLNAVNSTLSKGEFTEGGQTWLFVEQGPPRFNDNTPPNSQRRFWGSISLIVATPTAQRSFRDVLREVAGGGFFAATAQALCIGMLVAFLLSIWIVRWVSRPIIHISQGALQFAQGNYATRVEGKGPRETRILAQAFNEMAERVEANQRSQRDFLANVTHDLRTPLTSIQGFAQAIIDGVADRKVAEIILNEASRLNRMVTDLLDLARIEAGRMDMMRHSVEIDMLLQNIGQNLSLKASEHAVQLNVDVPDLPRIAGDGDRLAQVFTNLVDNAIKHTPQGGRVQLKAHLDDATKGVVVLVEDTGEGIPAPDLPRIFERFYQVDKSRTKQTGTGLGLAITHEIVKAHNGKIAVESELGRGTRFSVWLPQPIIDTGKTVLTPRSGLR